MSSLCRTFAVFFAAAALAACDSAAPPAGKSATPPPPAAPTSTASSAPDKPILGDFGFDTAGMDRSIVPGDEFYDYANGNWVRHTEIPADRASYTSFTQLAEQALADTRAIAEEAASQGGAAKGDTAKIGDYYAAFMDAQGIEAAGLAPLQPALDAIPLIADKVALARALGARLRTDVDLLNATDYYTPNLFGMWISVNLLQPDAYVPYLVQGGLGMPDRDFYLQDGRMADLRGQYASYIARLFELAGIDAGADKAARILALETAMARVHASQVETNDVQRGANPWLRADFARRAPGLDWDAFFTAAGLQAQPNFIVWQPQALIGLAALVDSEPLQTWRDWLTFHALDGAAPYLPRVFADAHFAFHGTALAGTPEQPERWKRGLGELNQALGEAVGKRYVERHFSPAIKARADTMVQHVLAAFGARIDALTWMSEPTKAHARAKLARLTVGMGYPDHWRDYTALEVRRDDALGNAQRASQFEYRRNLAKLGRPIDRDEWFLLPQEVNALNVPLENRLIFPAAILHAPFFDAAADDAVNYGAIGAVIGHEISHSFDNTGALFDETGKLENWWTPQDLEHFEAAGKALVAQYDTYRPFPDLAVNGELTLGENIADVAGLATALDAYRIAHPGPGQALDAFSPEQRFFLGWAQAWRSKMREPALRNRILTNVHAPGHYRALTVRNLDAWYPAFEVQQEQDLYLVPEQRVRIW
ncbi:M13 family metallopeptidase [Dokdonella sp.]|uniref:M13 family metallopeptidase n=1 Tax=Dokdonella sp. TaxID=2291710 RepID=UPI0031BC3732|nr:M13 family metallopeptidase [Dokdonella sp.]